MNPRRVTDTIPASSRVDVASNIRRQLEAAHTERGNMINEVASLKQQLGVSNETVARVRIHHS
jgi:DNA-binding GntR family transcriptional regulator